ncbi:MAG: phosphatidylserine decarboxylase [Pseudomonadota bacterium]
MREDNYENRKERFDSCFIGHGIRLFLYCHAEVGGFLVGSIVQTCGSRIRVGRGDEKGYFKFGGSTVTLLFKEGMVNLDADILGNSRGDMETAVLLGSKIGIGA